MNSRQFVLSCVGVAASVCGVVAFAVVGEAEPQTEIGNCAAYSGLPAGDDETAGMVFIPSGTFRMGSERHQPEERFTHVVRVDGFWIDRHEVTNAQFKQFIDATGYRTLAERGLDAKDHPGLSKELLAPGSVVFIKPTALTRGGRITEWWRYVPGVDWRHPNGAESSLVGRDNYPVVHIAYEDALAYAGWHGRQLPTEAQWEFAARGGRDGEDDWPSAFDLDGKAIANTWQGLFPVFNSSDDGHEEAAPVGCYKANGYGLYDMIGNVWEWTGDWYRGGHSREAAVNPTGPDLGSIQPAPGQAGQRVIKGGSFLCAPNFCARYRPAARQAQDIDLGAGHLGFRTVLNKPNSGSSP